MLEVKVIYFIYNWAIKQKKHISRCSTYYQIKELIKIKELGVPSLILAEKAYEAGKLDKELSLMFDNPKGRFLNSEIKLWTKEQ